MLKRFDDLLSVPRTFMIARPTHKITSGTLRGGTRWKFRATKRRRIPSRSFISLIAHGYDAAAASAQDDFIAVLGIEGVIFHARNFLMKHGIFSGG